jgi:hypothetical protein
VFVPPHIAYRSAVGWLAFSQVYIAAIDYYRYFLEGVDWIYYYPVAALKQGYACSFVASWASVLSTCPLTSTSSWTQYVPIADWNRAGIITQTYPGAANWTAAPSPILNGPLVIGFDGFFVPNSYGTIVYRDHFVVPSAIVSGLAAELLDSGGVLLTGFNSGSSGFLSCLFEDSAGVVLSNVTFTVPTGTFSYVSLNRSNLACCPACIPVLSPSHNFSEGAEATGSSGNNYYYGSYYNVSNINETVYSLSFLGSSWSGGQIKMVLVFSVFATVALFGVLVAAVLFGVSRFRSGLKSHCLSGFRRLGFARSSRTTWT